MQTILNYIIKYSIYVLVFLLPVFFLPFSFEVFEYSKQYLLFFLVSLAFFAWLAKMVIYDKEIRFRCSPLDYFVLGFLFIAIISAIFSVDKNSSIFGFYGRFSNGLIGLLSLGALYFLVTNTVRDIKGLLRVFLYSAGVVVLISYLSIFQVWQKIGDFLPRVMQQRTFNPVAGSLEGLSVFLAVVAVLLAGLLFTRKGKNTFPWILLLGSLGLMVIIDFTLAWPIILITLLIAVGFSMWKRLFRENVNQLLIPIFLIIVAGVLILFQPIKIGLPQEQVLSQQISWEVGLKSAIDDVKSGFLGSGIGTFHYDFAKHRPQEINESWLWQIRFDRAGSAVAEKLATMGFLGLLSWLVLVGLFLLISWLLAMSDATRSRVTLDIELPLLMAFLALLIGQFVYYQNTTLSFLFWLMLGLGVVSWQRPVREKAVSFKDFSELSLVFSTLVIILGVGILAGYFYAGKFYWADVNYSKALFMLGDQRVQALEKAVKLNPQLPNYRTVLARAYLFEALTEMAKPAAQQNANKIQLEVARAIDQARAATILQPNQVAAWETLSVIYREIGGVAAGAVDWGIKSFEKSITLEPTNPVFYTELGKLYLAKGDTPKAKEYFQQAIEKKSDYADVLIQEALLLERGDALGEAVKKLESLVGANPFNIEMRFQLGRLYFNNGQISEAIGQFQQVVILVPDHSNAHYSLGVAYASQGKIQLAIEEFERVLELNPGNQDVIQKLKNLKGE